MKNLENQTLSDRSTFTVSISDENPLLNEIDSYFRKAAETISLKTSATHRSNSVSDSPIPKSASELSFQLAMEEEKNLKLQNPETEKKSRKGEGLRGSSKSAAFFAILGERNP